jgi:hypothetical protein
MSGKIVRMSNVTQSAVGNKDGLIDYDRRRGDAFAVPLPGIVTKDCSIASLFLNLRRIEWTFLGFTISAEDKVNAEPEYAGRY